MKSGSRLLAILGAGAIAGLGCGIAMTTPAAAAPSFGADPYVMPLANNPPDLPAVMAASGVSAFTLAFVVSGGGCTPAWEADSGLIPVASDTQVMSQVSAIRAAGGDVAVSFGGYGGTKLGQTCGSAQATAAAEEQVIDKYHLKAVDLDLEEPEIEISGAINNELTAGKIIESNAQSAGRSLFLSITLPSTNMGPNYFGKLLLQNAASVGVRVDSYSIMPFDYGGSNMGQGAVSAADALHADLKTYYPALSDAQLYHMSGFSLMNGTTDSGESFTAADFQTDLAYAQGHGLSRFTFWSVNRDRPCANPGGGVSGTCSGVAQAPWAFSGITARFSGGQPHPPPPTPTLGAPGAPTGVTAAAGFGSATVSWRAPASDGGSPVTYYAVYGYSPTAPGSMSVVGGTSTTVTGLGHNAYYAFTVTAWNGSRWGAWSAWSGWALTS